MPLGSGRFERPGVIGDRRDDRGDRGGGLRDRLQDRRDDRGDRRDDRGDDRGDRGGGLRDRLRDRRR